MAKRAALVTGASSGIGFALTRMLAEEGHGVTMVARRPEKLQNAADSLSQVGLGVFPVPADISQEDQIQQAVTAHQQQYKRLDVLVNNAGLGIGRPLEEQETKYIDLQIDVNLRAQALFYRECIPMLKQAGHEHRNALAINTASIVGKKGSGWVSIYSATKHGVVGLTESMNKELSKEGIKSCALCPGFVDTPMVENVRNQLSDDEIIQPEDIAEVVRALLRLSPGCIVPEVMFIRPGM